MTECIVLCLAFDNVYIQCTMYMAFFFSKAKGHIKFEKVLMSMQQNNIQCDICH